MSFLSISIITKRIIAIVSSFIRFIVAVVVTGEYVVVAVYVDAVGGVAVRAGDGVAAFDAIAAVKLRRRC